MSEDLPWICPDHPRAEIRHVWDQVYSVMNGYPVGTGYAKNDHYYCGECGRELAKDSPVKEAV